ncbi:MAG: phosphatase PAP2 family protein [Syntrophales bacterium LBB04]|nr:phosphatase PAP2 family protein [Syntrophales bacterium LBB04]
MKHRILRIKISLFVALSGLIAGIDVQASGRIETAGDVLMITLPTAAAGLTLGFRDGQGALEFGKSAALSLGVTYGLKYSIDEKRPNGDKQSFPSAHTSISFASAEFLRKRYGWDYGIPAYIVATFVAYSRVESKQHYTHDVITGAAIGIGNSYLFTQSYKGWHIQPDVDHAYYGICLSHNW